MVGVKVVNKPGRCKDPHGPHESHRKLAGGGFTADSLVKSSSGNLIPAAAMFSSTWATDDVPGIGSMNLDRRSSHASATCKAVAPISRAIDEMISCASRFCPKGAQGMKAI